MVEPMGGHAEAIRHLQLARAALDQIRVDMFAGRVATLGNIYGRQLDALVAYVRADWDRAWRETAVQPTTVIIRDEREPWPPTRSRCYHCGRPPGTGGDPCPVCRPSARDRAMLGLSDDHEPIPLVNGALNVLDVDDDGVWRRVSPPDSAVTEDETIDP